MKSISLLIISCIFLACTERETSSQEASPDDIRKKIAEIDSLTRSFRTENNKADTCRYSFFRNIDATATVVVIKAWPDSVRYGELNAQTESEKISVIKFPSDSCGQYAFCTDLFFANCSRGYDYQFSSGNIYEWISKAGDKTRFVVHIDSAYFKLGRDSILVRDFSLWNDYHPIHGLRYGDKM